MPNIKLIKEIDGEYKVTKDAIKCWKACWQPEHKMLIIHVGDAHVSKSSPGYTIPIDAIDREGNKYDCTIFIPNRAKSFLIAQLRTFLNVRDVKPSNIDKVTDASKCLLGKVIQVEQKGEYVRPKLSIVPVSLSEVIRRNLTRVKTNLAG